MSSVIKALRPYFGVLPAFLTIAVFLILPLCIVLVFSFLKPGDYGSVKPVFSTDAYTRLLFQKDLFDNLGFDPAYLIIACRSLLIALVAVFGCLALGFPVA